MTSDVPFPLRYKETANLFSKRGSPDTGFPEEDCPVDGKILVTPEPATSTVLPDRPSEARNFLEKLRFMLLT